MNKKVLPQNTEIVLEKLKDEDWLNSFYLAGGTGLALQYGHRRSQDLDWFTDSLFSSADVRKKIAQQGDFELFNEADNTVEGVFEEVKLSFMTYPYPLLDKLKQWEDIKIASPLDIAIMKLGAIAGRNTKKDFIDLYFILNTEGLTIESLIEKANEKFSPEKYDSHHIYKSLSYFEEADEEPMPEMLKEVNWEQVKSFFVDRVENKL